MEEIKKVFTDIYNSKQWQTDSNTESVSGSGSTLKNTKKTRKHLPLIIKKEKIKSLIDVGCGDLNWIKNLLSLFKKYKGIDVVKELIDTNIRLYGNDNISFKTIDIISYNIEKLNYDAVLLKDILVHLKTEQVIFLLNKIKKSNIKYIIATNFYEVEINKDIELIGQWRPLNLILEPFNLGNPKHVIKETIERYKYNDIEKNDKTLSIWKLK